MPANLAIHRLSARTPARAQPVAARLALQALGADLEDALPRSLPPQALLWLRRLSLQVPAAALTRPAPPAWRADWIAAGRDRMDAALARAARPALGPVAEDAEAVLFADAAEMLACLALAARAGQLDRWWWRGLLGRTWPQWQAAWAARPEARGAAQRLLVRAGFGPAEASAPEIEGHATDPADEAPTIEAVAVPESFGVALDRPHASGEVVAAGSALRPTRVGTGPAKAPVEAGEGAAEPMFATSAAPAEQEADVVLPEPGRPALPDPLEVALKGSRAARRQARVLASPEPLSVANWQALALPDQLEAQAVRTVEGAAYRRADVRDDIVQAADDEPRPVAARKSAAPGQADAPPTDAAVASLPPAASAPSAESVPAPPLRARSRKAATPADTASHDQPRPLVIEATWPWPQALQSRQAPLLFIVNALLEDGLYPDFTRPLDPGLPVPLWALLLALAQAWRLPQDDALHAALAERADGWQGSGTMPAAPGVAAGPWRDWLPAYARSLRRRLCKRLGLRAANWPRALTLHQPARLWLSEAEWVIEFDLAGHDVAWRLAGLDRDPGWLPTADCTLRFRFLC